MWNDAKAGGNNLKKIFVTNGNGRSGKDTFVSMINKYIPALKYSIIDLPKEAAEILGWNGGKTEKDRKFLSDLMDLATEYNNSPYKDVTNLVEAFKKELPYEVMFIDMRDPKDISRAVIDFNAETILIDNPNVRKIESNHADANVKNYDYDYIIENDGTLEQLDKMAYLFTEQIIKNNCFEKPAKFKCSNLVGEI